MNRFMLPALILLIFVVIVPPATAANGIGDERQIKTSSTSGLPPAMLTQADFGGLPEVNDHFGMVTAVGDFNGDGYEDLANGCPLEDQSGQSNAGVVLIAYGSANGLCGDPDWPGVYFFQTVAGGNIEAGDQFGFALACGDFNGDGYDDLAAGAPYDDIAGETNAGCVTIIFGSAAGLNEGPASAVWFSQDDMSDMSLEADDRFGYALAVVQLNDDQYDDLAIGSPGEDLGNGCLWEDDDLGTVAIVEGSSYSNWAHGLFANEVLDPLDFLLDWECLGPSPEFLFGSSLASVGNNGLAIGVPGWDKDFDSSDEIENCGIVVAIEDLSNTGYYEHIHRKYLYEGDRFGCSLAAGDFDGDGYEDLVIRGSSGTADVLLNWGEWFFRDTDPVTGYSLRRYKFDETREGNGQYGLAAGDLNGDGYDDIVAGRNLADPAGNTDAGEVTLIFADEWDPPYHYFENWAMLDLDQWDTGYATPEPQDYFGFSVAVGDFNGDGKNDLAVGASNEDIGSGDDEGVVCVFYNRPVVLDATYPADQVIAPYTAIPVLPLSGFSIENKSWGESFSFRYEVLTTGPAILDDNGDPVSLAGTTPVLAPGESFSPPAAALAVPAISETTAQAVTYRVTPQGISGVVYTGTTNIVFMAPVPVFISSFSVHNAGSVVELTWDIQADEEVIGFKIYRSAGEDGVRELINADSVIPTDVREYRDTSTGAGRSYEYTLGVVLADGGEISSQTISVTIDASELVLNQNHPNPFNPSTTITFTSPKAGWVTLNVYDASGKLIRTLVNEEMPTGSNDVAWNGTDNAGNRVSSGVYFYRLTAGKQTLTKKMVLLK